MSEKTLEVSEERELNESNLEEGEDRLVELESVLEGDLSEDEREIVAAINYEHGNQLSLRDMIESDASADRKKRQLERTDTAYTAAHFVSAIGALSWDVFGGGDLTKIQMHNALNYTLFGGSLGSLYTKRKFDQENIENNFSKMAWTDHYIIDNKTVKDLLRGSEIVIREENFSERYSSGEEAAEVYDGGFNCERQLRTIIRRTKRHSQRVQRSLL